MFGLLHRIETGETTWRDVFLVVGVIVLALAAGVLIGLGW